MNLLFFKQISCPIYLEGGSLTPALDVLSHKSIFSLILNNTEGQITLYNTCRGMYYVKCSLSLTIIQNKREQCTPVIGPYNSGLRNPLPYIQSEFRIKVLSHDNIFPLVF